VARLAFACPEALRSSPPTMPTPESFDLYPRLVVIGGPSYPAILFSRYPVGQLGGNGRASFLDSTLRTLPSS